MANEHSSSSDGKWGREIREAEAKEKSNATTPPTTPSDAAMRAAKEIAFRINGGEDDENLSYPKALSDLMDNPSIANEQAFASWLAAIITRHLAATPSVDLPFDDYCAGGDCRNCKGVNCTCPHHAPNANAESLYAKCRRVWVCKRCGNCLDHCRHKDESNFHEDLAMPCSVKTSAEPEGEQDV